MTDLLARLSRSWRRHRVAAAPVTRRLFRCERCGRPLFFRNSKCLGCGAEVGYAPELGTMITLPEGQEAPYRINTRAPSLRRRGDARDESVAARELRVVRCANSTNAAGCNWLVTLSDHDAALSPALLCRSCVLTRTIPDQSVAENAGGWARFEEAKRQVVSTLITLGLPVQSRVEDPARGLAFDLLRAPEGGPAIVTGHADGVITLDVEEADDATREQRRTAMHEPYRTLVGHLRHEIGHYYWYRLVDGAKWLDPFRAVFGDERRDYAGALADHYRAGPPADWPLSFVSAYASAHPWEDWAESWAHYLHMIDALDTALSFGVGARAIESKFEPFDVDVLGDAGRTHSVAAAAFLAFVNAWIELATALNELARSMGQPDFYPFVLSAAAVRKLHFVHRVITHRDRRKTPPPRAPAPPGMAVAEEAH